jgi:hypothetical protein
MELKRALSQHQAVEIQRKLPPCFAILAEKYGAASYTEFALIVPILTDGAKFGFDALVKFPEMEFDRLNDAVDSHIELYREHVADSQHPRL